MLTLDNVDVDILQCNKNKRPTAIYQRDLSTNESYQTYFGFIEMGLISVPMDEEIVIRVSFHSFIPYSATGVCLTIEIRDSDENESERNIQSWWIPKAYLRNQDQGRYYDFTKFTTFKKDGEVDKRTHLRAPEQAKGDDSSGVDQMEWRSESGTSKESIVVAVQRGHLMTDQPEATGVQRPTDPPWSLQNDDGDSIRVIDMNWFKPLRGSNGGLTHRAFRNFRDIPSNLLKLKRSDDQVDSDGDTASWVESHAQQAHNPNHPSKRANVEERRRRQLLTRCTTNAGASEETRHARTTRVRHSRLHSPTASDIEDSSLAGFVVWDNQSVLEELAARSESYEPSEADVLEELHSVPVSAQRAENTIERHPSARDSTSIPAHSAPTPAASASAKESHAKSQRDHNDRGPSTIELTEGHDTGVHTVKQESVPQQARNVTGLTDAEEGSEDEEDLKYELREIQIKRKLRVMEKQKAKRAKTDR